MLDQMAWESSEDCDLGLLLEDLPDWSESPQSKPSTTDNISEHEFSCHCCYDILVNPTTLTCGHNFCRHCLALWWESSHKNECPECREKWEGFPKINILLRYVFHSHTISVKDGLIFFFFWPQYLRVSMTYSTEQRPTDALYLQKCMCVEKRVCKCTVVSFDYYAHFDYI